MACPPEVRVPGQTDTSDAVVIIPHRNDLTRLMRCLDALEGQDRTGIEVLVVDNGSKVDLTPLAARHPWVRLIVEPSPGAAAARNLGVAESSARWMFFLDADCLPDADWIATARRIAVSDPHQIIGGDIRTFNETPPPRSPAARRETGAICSDRIMRSRQGVRQGPG